MALDAALKSHYLLASHWLSFDCFLSFDVMESINAVACGWPNTGSVISQECIVMALAITYIMDSVKSSSLLCLSLCMMNEAKSFLCQSHFILKYCA